MKKRFWIAMVALLATCGAVKAQEQPAKTFGFWENWFVQGQFGAQHTYSESHRYSTFWEKISPTAAVNVGKLFSPRVGGRLQLGGWSSKNNMVGKTYNVNYWNLNMDAMFNLTNTFLAYREDRIFNLMGIIGIGYVRRLSNDDQLAYVENVGSRPMDATNSIAPRVGLQGDFRLSKRWSLNLELNGNLMRDDFNGQEKFGADNDGLLNVLAGVTYRFKNKGGMTREEIDADAMKRMNDEVNRLRGQVEEYKTCCDRKQVVPEPKTIIKEVPASRKPELNLIVVYRIGKAAIDKNQQTNLYNVAQFMKKNPEAKITVSSFADKKTGTPEFNQMLTEKRSEAIVKVLTKKYGIEQSRIKVENNGDRIQPYPDNNSWNRVSIIVSQ